MSILIGRPNTYLSPNWYATGAKLAIWIQGEIPCFVGNVPMEYTDALLAVFKKHYVPPQIVYEAFLILDKQGIRFDGSGIGLAQPQPINRSGAPPAPQMKGVTGAEARRIKLYTFQEYERRYVLALKTNDFAGAEAIIVAVLTLLWEWARGYSKMRQDARNDKMVEWEEFNTAVNQALERAQTLETHIRRLSRDEIRQLRSAPSPTSLRNLATQLAQRLTARNIPARSRRRR